MMPIKMTACEASCNIVCIPSVSYIKDMPSSLRFYTSETHANLNSAKGWT